MRVRSLCAAGVAAMLLALPTAAAAAASGYSDPFLHAAPTGEPGDVLKARQDLLVQFPGSEVEQLVFRSTDSHGGPVAAAATLVRPPGMRDNAPIVAYDHFTNTLAADCQPTAAFYADDPEGQFVAAQMAGANIALARGWAVLLVDHEGPDAAYAANIQAGRITLDAIRAATGPQYRTELSPAAVAGYSGGSSAAYFAASQQPDYAPDVDLVGAALGGLPADYVEQIEFGLRGSGPHPGAGLAIAAALGLSRQYPQLDVRERLSGDGHAIADRMEGACTQTLLTTGGEVGDLAHVTGHTKDALLTDPAIRDVLERESAIYARAPNVPLYIWQSPNDGLLPYGPVAQVAGQACAAGTPTVLSPASGTDHLTVAVTGMPAAIDWIAARFRGEPAPMTC